MTREIRYNAYYKPHNYVYNVIKIDFQGINNNVREVTLSNGELIRSDRLDDVVLLQYTGIKDKYGVTIYEGDIVKGLSCYENGKEEVIGQVKYLVNSYVLCNKDEEPIEYFDDDSHETYGLECWRGWNEEYDEVFEVIGNIYESNHLL